MFAAISIFCLDVLFSETSSYTVSALAVLSFLVDRPKSHLLFTNMDNRVPTMKPTIMNESEVRINVMITASLTVVAMEPA